MRHLKCKSKSNRTLAFSTFSCTQILEKMNSSELHGQPCDFISSQHNNNNVFRSEKTILSNIAKEFETDPVRFAVIVEAVEDLKRHFLEQVLALPLHPTVKEFFEMETTEIVRRYCELNPAVKSETLEKYLHYEPQHFFFAGVDLFNVVTNSGERKMTVVETNSCGAGKTDMPPFDDDDVYCSYRKFANNFMAYVRKNSELELGGLAVIYDTNDIEAHGSAYMISSVSQEPVLFVEFSASDPNPPVRWVGNNDSNVMEVRDENGIWHSIRAAVRNVTEKPWTRIPLKSRTLILNPILSCLCGGRNKAMGYQAYDDFNKELTASESGLKIEFLKTKANVKRSEILQTLREMGGRGVIKMPYLNCGRGVFTIATAADLRGFTDASQDSSERYVVQEMVEPLAWQADAATETKNYHMGTVPDKLEASYVNDIRMLVCGGENGFQPVSICSRRARTPIGILDGLESSWSMLGTNLTIRTVGSNKSAIDTERLIVLNSQTFDKLNLSIDELVKGYIQSVLSVIAIDKICMKLMRPGEEFDKKLFEEMNPDTSSLIKELKSI